MAIMLPETPKEHEEELREEEEPQDWYFTFGFAHRLVVVNTERGDLETSDAATLERMGFPLENRYVRITGTRIEARLEMIERFGHTWSNQYDEERFLPLISKYGLKELRGLA
jgi:hypothetical protein